MQTCLQLPSGYAAGKAFWRMKKDKFDIGRGCSNDFVKLQNLAPNADKSDDEGSTANEVKVSIFICLTDYYFFSVCFSYVTLIEVG